MVEYKKIVLAKVTVCPILNSESQKQAVLSLKANNVLFEYRFVILNVT